ncbi:MAG TPA: glycogen/starch synthase [Sphingobacteriaceae bacterium]|nr:glycogen/starch synthase [Sphingobacteriaceae bacterium]
MRVFHLSAECFPIAKAGGLGDVVGALPKYLNAGDVNASVIIPYYDRPFVHQNTFITVYQGTFLLGDEPKPYHILKEQTDKLGFPLFMINVPGLLDRTEIYGYPDEQIQFIAFQLAFLDWMLHDPEKPDIIHCHDHHSGLIPFLINYAYRYNSLKDIPTVFTIHNGEYQGWMDWKQAAFLPAFDPWKAGYLDWDYAINPMAAAIKCSWKFTTVSPGYLSELLLNCKGLEPLFQAEWQKGLGILNGIDDSVWNPETDEMISPNYNTKTAGPGKLKNKKVLCTEFGLDHEKALVVFIGRLVTEKGADLLPEILLQSLNKSKEVNFLILGSGEKAIENSLAAIGEKFPTQCSVFIGYNEKLSHRIYAGADFLIMPSRVEPCGLNQLYSLKYGTMPLVSNTGGLKDTVRDFEKDNEGYGITFNTDSIAEAVTAIDRALTVYQDKTLLKLLRERMMSLDFSWNNSANQYIKLYQGLKPTLWNQA